MRYSALVALAMGNAVYAASNSTMTSGTASTSGTATTSGTASTSGTATTSSVYTGAPTAPATAAGFTFLGCFGSSDGFPTFSLETSSNDMSPEICGTACAGSNYFGVYSGDCYCGDKIEAATSSQVADGQCDIPCPGNPESICGGVNQNARLARRQVPAAELLSVYEASGLNPTVTETLTRTITGASTTIVSTIVATATVGPAPIDIIIICIGDYCIPQTYCEECSKYRVICSGEICYTEECDGDDMWNWLVIEDNGMCSYSNCTGDECNRKITCTGNNCVWENECGEECEKKCVCTGDDCSYESCTGEDCYTQESCDEAGTCTVVEPCGCTPPAPVIVPTATGAVYTAKPVATGSSSSSGSSSGSSSSGSSSSGETPAVVTAGSGKMIPAVGVTVFGLVAGVAFLL